MVYFIKVNYSEKPLKIFLVYLEDTQSFSPCNCHLPHRISAAQFAIIVCGWQLLMRRRGQGRRQSDGDCGRVELAARMNIDFLDPRPARLLYEVIAWQSHLPCNICCFSWLSFCCNVAVALVICCIPNAAAASHRFASHLQRRPSASLLSFPLPIRQHSLFPYSAPPFSVAVIRHPPPVPPHFAAAAPGGHISFDFSSFKLSFVSCFTLLRHLFARRPALLSLISPEEQKDFPPRHIIYATRRAGDKFLSFAIFRLRLYLV